MPAMDLISSNRSTLEFREATNPLASHIDFALLSAALMQALRTTVFSSGLSVSPKRVNQIGSEMGAAFFGFYPHKDANQALALGRRFANEGLGPRSVLSMTEALRRTCREHANPLTDLIDAAGEFSNSLLEGYMAGREEILLDVQERTHRAYLAALHRQQEESEPLVPGE